MGGERKEVKSSIGLSLNGSTFQGETKVNKFAQQIKYDCKFWDILCLLDLIENLKIDTLFKEGQSSSVNGDPRLNTNNMLFKIPHS